MRALIASCLLAAVANADLYLHAPRGSNNRLDDQNRDRDNGDRVFDSQNNNRGGYNVGQVYFYAGSVMPMEWTNQHACGSSNNNCEIIIQYMCDPLIRDGTVTTTIPDNPAQCLNYDCDTDVRFGRQESYAYYQSCKNTERNKGLFTSAQKLNGNDARYTRQNPNGNRRGYECPEERDYYPYWRPTPWMDIAILTNQPQRCAAYQAQSQNVVGRGYCSVPSGWTTMMVGRGMRGFIPITQVACEAIRYYDNTVNQTLYGTWMVQPEFGLPAPECRDAQWTRDNHLGNAAGTNGDAASFNWTIPSKVISEHCVVRMRYNISTGDFDHFAANDRLGLAKATGNLASTDSLINNFNNSGSPQNPANDPARLNYSYTRFGLTFEDNAASFDTNRNRNQATLKTSREYVLKDNPRVNIFGSLLPSISLKLQLAIDTAQYGRTFQDRSHKMAIRATPKELQGVTIHNVQVRGKRGNIVQVYPGVEYDYFPNSLEVQLGDYVHFQWTGSNTNPQNNDGQGTPGTDRSNIVALRPPNYSENQGVTSPVTVGQFGNMYPVKNIDAVPFLGFSHADLVSLATLNTNQNGGAMDELNDAGTYFDLGPRPVKAMGIFHYMCTRNNNFSNRSQQGKIVVSASSTVSNALGFNGGTIATAGASVTAGAQAFTGLQLVTVTSTPAASMWLSEPDNVVSSVVTVAPTVLGTANGQAVTVSVPYTAVARAFGAAPKMYQAATAAGPWSEIDADCSGGVCSAQSTSGGVFILKSPLNIGALIGVIIAGLVVIGLVVGYVFRRRCRKVLLPNSQDKLAQDV